MRIEQLSNREVARSDLGDLQGAISDYNKAIEIKPNFAEAYNKMGVAHAEWGNYQAAIADYNKAIQINQNFAEVYNN